MRDQRLEIKDIVKYIDNATLGKLDVPEFQRKFVWTPEKAKNLVDSLWRGYPVGALLLWESTYNSPKTALGTQAEKLWVVDGQQRITSLALLFGKKPYWWDRSDDWNRLCGKYDVLVDVSKSAKDLEFGLPNPVRKNSANWISVRRILNSTNLSEFAQVIGQSNPQLGFAHMHEALQAVRRIENFPIFEIIIDHELEDVAEIFSRLNTAGTKIKESDVVIALVASKQQGWVRDEFDPFLKELSDKGFEIDPGILIRTLAAIGKGAARLREIPQEFWDASKPFEEHWNRTKESISFIHKKLSEKGILSSDLLPAHNALVPLFTIYATFSDEFDFDRAFRWFLLALRDGRYSGSATTTLDQDIKHVKNASCFEAATEILGQQLKTSADFKAQEFLTDYRDDFLALMLYLIIFRSGAKDWQNQEVRIGFDKSEGRLNEGFKPEWHHFFPKRVLRGAKIEDERINTLGNIVVLNERANRTFSSKEPRKYLEEYNVDDKRLVEQFVPVDEKLMDVSQYEQFIEARASALADASQDYLKDLNE